MLAVATPLVCLHSLPCLLPPPCQPQSPPVIAHTPHMTTTNALGASWDIPAGPHTQQTMLTKCFIFRACLSAALYVCVWADECLPLLATLATWHWRLARRLVTWHLPPSSAAVAVDARPARKNCQITLVIPHVVVAGGETQRQRRDISATFLAKRQLPFSGHTHMKRSRENYPPPLPPLHHHTPIKIGHRQNKFLAINLQLTHLAVN